MSARSRERLADDLATLGLARLAIRVRIGEFGTWSPEETTSRDALIGEIDRLVLHRPDTQRPAIRRLAAMIGQDDFAESEAGGGEELRGHLQIAVLSTVRTPHLRVVAGPGNYADFTSEQATEFAHELIAAAKRLDEEVSAL